MQSQQSNQWKLNFEDVKSLIRNGLIFFSPVLIIGLVTLQNGGTFEQVNTAAQVWAMGVAINFFRRISAGK